MHGTDRDQPAIGVIRNAIETGRNLAFTRACDFVARCGGEEFALLSSESLVETGQAGL